jgi:hypothetical protein
MRVAANARILSAPSARPAHGFKNPFLPAQESRDGNRTRRTESEVEEYPSIGCVLSALRPRRVQPLSQRLAGRRTLVLAQPEKVIRADAVGQTRMLHAEAKPFAGHRLALILIITDAETFFKVFPCIC